LFIAHKINENKCSLSFFIFIISIGSSKLELQITSTRHFNNFSNNETFFNIALRFGSIELME